MVASKMFLDDTYSNKSWSIAAQNMFALREINLMEREMCSYLHWDLNIHPGVLKQFEQMVRRDFRGSGPYPTHTLPSHAPSPMPMTMPSNVPTDGSAPLPAILSQPPLAPPSISPSKPISPPVPMHAGAPPISRFSSPTAQDAPPDTPPSGSTSPSSSSSSTSVGHENRSVHVVPSRAMGMPVNTDPASSTAPSLQTAVIDATTYQQNVLAVIDKGRRSAISAYARPCVW